VLVGPVWFNIARPDNQLGVRVIAGGQNVVGPSDRLVENRLVVADLVYQPQRVETVQGSMVRHGVAEVIGGRIEGMISWCSGMFAPWNWTNES
jgi:hypothetical protein